MKNQRIYASLSLNAPEPSSPSTRRYEIMAKEYETQAANLPIRIAHLTLLAPKLTRALHFFNIHRQMQQLSSSITRSQIQQNNRPTFD